MIDATEPRIDAWAQKLSQPATIALAQDDSQAGRVLSAFGQALCKKSPLIKLQKNPEKALWRPALIVGRHANIYFQAIPYPVILPDFLAAITDTGGQPGLDPASTSLLARLKTPLLLKLYTGQGCPFCPGMVNRLLKLASGSRLVKLAVVDAALCADQAGSDGVRSVPTTILDGGFRWTGLVEIREILDLATTCDPSTMSPACLRQLLEDGQAAQAAAMMTASGKVFPALLELLVHKLWSVRLGAMVVLEYLADEQPELTAGLASDLWQRYQPAGQQVKGDILYMLGVLASAEARSYIEQALGSTGDSQIREAARDALDSIKDRDA